MFETIQGLEKVLGVPITKVHPELSECSESEERDYLTAGSFDDWKAAIVEIEKELKQSPFLKESSEVPKSPRLQPPTAILLITSCS